MSVRLVDRGTGEEITEPGRPGEPRIKGPTVFPGYLDGDRMPDPFDEHGYLRTGDVFEIAGEHGEFLRYAGRTGDLIVRGGVNISPAELEGLIATHPAVRDVAVVGYPDEVMGERVCAVVVPRDGHENGPCLSRVRREPMRERPIYGRPYVRTFTPGAGRSFSGPVLPPGDIGPGTVARKRRHGKADPEKPVRDIARPRKTCVFPGPFS
ncbi:hypothetical protein ACIBCT_33745 [Streptosporangium sp. NPDC050855]|uniref:AMP-binding enzyme n=1 Tax=Streptosporangium sp. NPDC050855 TaxID=3366194 RepID=UPI0037A8B038